MAYAVAASEGDSVAIFSSLGPDAYADGTPVQAGEAYALVWVSDEVDEFAGFDINGDVVDPENSALVMAHPLAELKTVDGETFAHCPRTAFQIPKAFTDSHKDKGGSYLLCLMDTRAADESGELVPTGDYKQNKGWGIVENASVRAGGSSVGVALNGGADEGTVADGKSLIPAGLELPQPKVVSIDVGEEYVTLKVTGTSPRLLYNANSGKTPQCNRRFAARKTVGGRPHASEEMTLIIPKGEERFFQVKVNP